MIGAGIRRIEVHLRWDREAESLETNEGPEASEAGCWP